MKKEDLRIGNYVRFKYGVDEYNIVNSIDPEQIGLGLITPFGVHPEDIEGIPLSEQWLLKLGFTETMEGYYDSPMANEKVICFNRYNESFMIGNTIDCELNWLPGFNIEHVHQLQNLFYSLEGKELISNIDL